MPIEITSSKILIALILISIVSIVKGQVLSIDKFEDNTNLNFYSEIYSTKDSLTPEQVEQSINSGIFSPIKGTSSAGFSEEYFWLRFTLVGSFSREVFIELDNPHIDYVKLFRKSNNGFELLGKAGDKMKFKDRSILNRRMIFDPAPVPGKENVYLLMIDKRYASVSFPLRIWSKRAFFEKEIRENLLFGLYFGVLAFIGLFSLFMGLGMGNRLFVSYGFYVLCVTMMIFTQLGFSFEFLYPQSSSLNNYARIVLLIVLTCASIHFFRLFLNVRRYNKVLYQIYNYTILLLLLILFGWILYKETNENYMQFTIALLNTLYSIIFLYFSSILYFILKTFSYHKKTVIQFLVAFSAVIVGSVLYLLIEYGVVPEASFVVNPVMAGSIIEILFLAVAMIWQVKAISDQKEQISRKFEKQQRQMVQAFVRGGENERKRISAELHDNIGSNLSLLKKKINRSTDNLDAINEELDQIENEIRNLSTELMPHDLNISGLQASIRRLVEKVKGSSEFDIDVQFIDFPSLNNEVGLHIYRVIQEALENIQKYASARNVEMQFIRHDEEIIVTVDDDGKGFDTAEIKNGNGLHNMRARVQSFNGKIEINSVVGRGTSIMINIPYSG